MRADLLTALCLESNNTKHTTTRNTIGTMRADLLTALCLESNTTETQRKELNMHEFLGKLEEYQTYFWTAKTKKDITTKLKEFEQIVSNTDDYVIQKAFETIIDQKINPVHGYINSIEISIIIDMFHILSSSNIAELPSLRMQLIQNLLYNWKETKYLENVADKYFNIFYQGLTPSEVIYTIQDVWKSYPEIELVLQMTYCGILLEKKEYKKFKYLLSTEMEFFVSCLDEISHIYQSFTSFERMTMHITTFTVLFYVLHCLLSSNPRPDIRETIVSCIQSMEAKYEILLCFYEGFYHFLMLLDKKQWPFTKNFIHQLMLHGSLAICAIIYVSVKLKKNNYHDESKNFLRNNLEHIKDAHLFGSYLDCKTRHGYSLILLEVLNDCSLSEDTYCTQLAVTALYSLRVSLVNNYMLDFKRCYCYMGRSSRCSSFSRISRKRMKPKILPWADLSGKSYQYLYKENKQDFVKEWKKFNGKLNKCINKKQQLHIKSEASSKQPSDLLNPSAAATDDAEAIDDDDDDNNDDHDDNNHNADNDDDDDDDDDDDTYSEEGYLYEINEMLRQVVDACKKAKKMKEFVQTLCESELHPEVEDLCTEAITNSAYIKLNRHNNIVQFVLDINKDIPECSLLTKLTLKVGESLHFNEQVIKDKNKVIYKCFCKIRHSVNNGDFKDINIDEYQDYFTFIKSMEKEEEMEKLVTFSEFLIIVMLLQKGSTYGGHHKSAEMKKYLSLKYEYDKAILYLLWCSGDVEINPGPTLKKLKSVPASQKLRAWIWDMCSILLKILKGFPVNSKPKDLWKDKPNNWPCEQPFYDPRNKSKGGNEDVKSDDRLLKCILDLCSQQQLDVAQYQREITAWKDDKKLLFELHTCRREIQAINTAIQCIINVKDTAELQQILGRKKMQITLPTQNFKNDNLPTQNVKNHKQKGTTDIIREVAVLLCKISKQIPPMEKSDGIWKSPPMRWKAGVPFYSPHNAGERSEKGQDKNLVNNLVEYIETENITIPSEYAALVTAWKQQNMQEMCKIYSVHTNVAVIENALKYLQLEGLLDKPDVLDKLKQHGLTLSTEWLNGCSTSTGICDSNQAGHQSSVNHSNEQQNSNGQNGSKCDSTGNSGSTPSCRKRSNTAGTQQSKGRCPNKKRKLLQDENIAMKKKREKLLADNDTLNKTLLTNQNQVISLEEDKAVHLTSCINCSCSPITNDNTGQSSVTSDKVFHVMSYESIPTNEIKDIQDIDFLFASKISDQDISSDNHSPPRQSGSKCKSSLKTIDKEIADIRKELNVEPPQMDAVSQTLNISTDQLSDMIDQYGLLSNNGLDVKQLENDKNNNSGSTENDLDIDLFELDKCEIDDEDKWSKNCEQQK